MRLKFSPNHNLSIVLCHPDPPSPPITYNLLLGATQLHHFLPIFSVGNNVEFNHCSEDRLKTLSWSKAAPFGPLPPVGTNMNGDCEVTHVPRSGGGTVEIWPSHCFVFKLKTCNS
eukprot:937556_1